MTLVIDANHHLWHYSVEEWTRLGGQASRMQQEAWPGSFATSPTSRKTLSSLWTHHSSRIDIGASCSRGVSAAALAATIRSRTLTQTIQTSAFPGDRYLSAVEENIGIISRKPIRTLHSSHLHRPLGTTEHRILHLRAPHSKEAA